MSSIQLKSDVRFRSLGEEGVVLCQDKGEVIGVNKVGARILELIQEELSIGQIQDTIAQEFDADEDLIGNDVAKYLSELRDSGVIEGEF